MNQAIAQSSLPLSSAPASASRSRGDKEGDLFHSTLGPLHPTRTGDGRDGAIRPSKDHDEGQGGLASATVIEGDALPLHALRNKLAGLNGENPAPAADRQDAQQTRTDDGENDDGQKDTSPLGVSAPPTQAGLAAVRAAQASSDNDGGTQRTDANGPKVARNVASETAASGAMPTPPSEDGPASPQGDGTAATGDERNRSVPPRAETTLRGQSLSTASSSHAETAANAAQPQIKDTADGGRQAAAPASSADAKGAAASGPTPVMEKMDGDGPHGDGQPPRRDDALRPDTTAGKAKVIEVQAAPAAPSSTMSQTASAVLGSIKAEAGAAPAPAQAPDPAAQAAASRPEAVRMLKIELTPASLGMVTARLRLVGAQLHVDLQVDTAEAHHRLKHDSDAIVKSLQAAGFDVDKVTVQQSPAHAAGPQGGQTGSASGRDPSFQQQAADGGRGDNSGSAGNGRQQGHEAAAHGGDRHQERAGGGHDSLFI